jgi:hypothetical protein
VPNQIGGIDIDSPAENFQQPAAHHHSPDRRNQVNLSAYSISCLSEKGIDNIGAAVKSIRYKLAFDL